jgi:metal-responsive CopG/Arc/MetJ family transcriptional regulator
MIARLVDLPQTMWDDLARIADAQGKKRNAYMRQILQQAIERDLPAVSE